MGINVCGIMLNQQKPQTYIPSKYDFNHFLMCTHTQSNTIAGSTLLATVGSLALNVLPQDTNINTQNI